MPTPNTPRRRSVPEAEVEAEVQRRVKERDHARSEIIDLVSEVVRPLRDELTELRTEVRHVSTTVRELESTGYERAVKLAQELGVWRGSAEERDALHRIIVQEVAKPARRKNFTFWVVVVGGAWTLFQLLIAIATLYLALAGVSHPALGR